MTRSWCDAITQCIRHNGENRSLMRRTSVHQHSAPSYRKTVVTASASARMRSLPPRVSSALIRHIAPVTVDVAVTMETIALRIPHRSAFERRRRQRSANDWAGLAALYKIPRKFLRRCAFSQDSGLGRRQHYLSSKSADYGYDESVTEYRSAVVRSLGGWPGVATPSDDPFTCRPRVDLSHICSPYVTRRRRVRVGIEATQRTWSRKDRRVNRMTA